MRGLTAGPVAALLFALGPALPAPAEEPAPGLVSRHGNWSLFDPGAGEDCFLTSYGTDAAGSPTKAQMFVQLRPGQTPPEEVSFLLPGGFGPGPARMFLGETAIEVLADGDWAWPPASLAHKDVLAAGLIGLEAADAGGQPLRLAFDGAGLAEGLVALRLRCR